MAATDRGFVKSILTFEPSRCNLQLPGCWTVNSINFPCFTIV